MLQDQSRQHRLLVLPPRLNPMAITRSLHRDNKLMCLAYTLRAPVTDARAGMKSTLIYRTKSRAFTGVFRAARPPPPDRGSFLPRCSRRCCLMGCSCLLPSRGCRSIAGDPPVAFWVTAQRRRGLGEGGTGFLCAAMVSLLRRFFL